MRSAQHRDIARWISSPLRWAWIAGSVATLMACSALPSASTREELASQSGGTCMPTSAQASVSASASVAGANAPTHIDMQGQLSIKLNAWGDQPAKGLSLGFFFTGNTDNGQLDLMTLMGSQMAQVHWTRSQAWLRNDKGRSAYTSLEALSLAALGEPLPLRTMVYWMQGQADPEIDVTPGPEPDTFVQSGWTIDTRQLSGKKLLAQRPASATQRGAHITIYLDR